MPRATATASRMTSSRKARVCLFSRIGPIGWLGRVPRETDQEHEFLPDLTSDVGLNCVAMPLRATQQCITIMNAAFDGGNSVSPHPSYDAPARMRCMAAMRACNMPRMRSGKIGAIGAWHFAHRYRYRHLGSPSV